MTALPLSLDLDTINEAILGLVSQAVLEGFSLGREPTQFKVNSLILDERRMEVMRLITTELAVKELETRQ